MKHCLNKRRQRNEISPINDQENLPQELQTRDKDKYQELPNSANEGRRKALKEKARQLVAETGCKPTHAHEIIARSLGYKTYNAFLADNK